MTEQYNAGAIEVLNGLEPVRRRQGCIRIQRAQTIWDKK